MIAEIYSLKTGKLCVIKSRNPPILQRTLQKHEICNIHNLKTFH